MKTFTKYLLRSLAVLSIGIIVVYTGGYLYVLSNKKNIISQIKEQVADKLNGEVKIGDIDLSLLSNFPGIAVEFQDISITDTVFNKHKHPFFNAAQLDAGISVINLLLKKNPLVSINITKGQLYLFTDSLGYTNSYLLNPKSKPDTTEKKSEGGKAMIESVKLKDVRLTLDDRRKHKLFDFMVNKFTCKIRNEDSLIRFKTKNDLTIKSLAFKTTNGSFLKDATIDGNFKAYFNKTKKKLYFTNIDLDVKDHPFIFSGAFVFNKVPFFWLKAATTNLEYEFGKSLLTSKIDSALSVLKMTKTLDDVKAEISGKLKGGNPLVNLQCQLTGNDVMAKFGTFENCQGTGSFSNELTKGVARKDPNSFLRFQNLSTHWEGLNIHANNVYIKNLDSPIIECDLKTSFKLPELSKLLASNTIDLYQGTGQADLTYSGPIEDNNNANTLINGKISFVDADFEYTPKNVRFKNTTGNILFKNTDVFVTNFKSEAQGNKITMNGSGKNLLALMRTAPGKINLDWNIYSPSINLGNFTTILQKRGKGTNKKKARSRLGAASRNIDRVVSQANFSLNVKADAFKFRNFTATNVKASLRLVNEDWLLNTISLQHAGGSMNITGYLKEKTAKYYQAFVKANMNNVDVNKVMYAFNNFGQDGISSKNLRGKLNSSINVKMDIDRTLSSTPANMDGYADFSLKNGALMHFEPMAKVQKIAFKNRNFDEIYFAELKDRLDFRNKEVYINRMEIQSTVLTLFVEGVYSLRGNTDISIQVPLSNIKKRDETYRPQNKGSDAKGGMSIFLRGTPGDDGNIQFKLDVFRRFRKNKVKELLK